jgi:hypothetical protein
MTAGPQSTPLAVAQCQKCQSYILQSQVNGCLTLVDPVPLKTVEEWREALIAGKALYGSGALKKLFPVYAKQMQHALGAGLALYVTHGCAAAGTVRASKVEAPPQGPQRAPVTPGGHPDGLRRPTAPVGGSQGHTAKITMEDYWGVSRSPARNVIPRPSRCCVCRKLLTGQEPGATTIEYNGRIVWGMHEH